MQEKRHRRRTERREWKIQITRIEHKAERNLYRKQHRRHQQDADEARERIADALLRWTEDS